MRHTIRRIALFFCFALCLALLTKVAQAQTYTVLYQFTGPCGANAFGGVTLDQSGNIEGTTAYGGAHDGGVVYRLSRKEKHGSAHLSTALGIRIRMGASRSPEWRLVRRV